MGFTSEQKRNASVIISVGRSVGASQRDILIALMVAFQESSLRNLSYGHLDSVGLFQQRTRGWASRSIRMDPYQSAKMFFTGGFGGAPGLFDKPNRGRMSLSQAAQAVQVSAFPSAYARWEDEARSLLGMAPGKAGQSIAKTDSGTWTRPVRNGTMTQEYGRPNSGYAAGHHTGIDYGVPMGTPVYSAAAGRVVRVTNGGAYGQRIEIEHGGKVWTLYAHLSASSVRVGDTVQAGQVIGKSGNSGNSSGPHLHFEVRQGANKYGNTVNPMKFLDGSTTPSAYIEDGQMLPADSTVTVPLSTADLLINQPLEKVAASMAKPYVYLNPIDMMAAPNIPVPTGPLNQLSSGPIPNPEPEPTRVADEGLGASPLEPEMV